MKKTYVAPTAEMIEFGNNDFLTSSAEFDPCNPGHGNGHGNAWGYNNGQHNGHGNGHNPHDNP